MEPETEGGTPVPCSEPEHGTEERVERLREAIKKIGSAREAARLSGLPYGTLQGYIRGGELKLSNAAPIARAAGVRLDWLASGDGPMQGEKFSHYYVPESVGIASGFLIAALHHAGLVTLTHTPNPMSFLNRLCGRPPSEKPVILLVVGYPKTGCQVPVHGGIKKPLDQIAAWL